MSANFADIHRVGAELQNGPRTGGPKNTPSKNTRVRIDKITTAIKTYTAALKAANTTTEIKAAMSEFNAFFNTIKDDIPTDHQKFLFDRDLKGDVAKWKRTSATALTAALNKEAAKAAAIEAAKAAALKEEAAKAAALKEEAAKAAAKKAAALRAKRIREAIETAKNVSPDALSTAESTYETATIDYENQLKLLEEEYTGPGVSEPQVSAVRLAKKALDEAQKNLAKAQRNELGALLLHDSLSFAGVWFSDSGPVRLDGATRRHDEHLLHPTNGVVAISGVVPLLLSFADCQNMNISPGDQLFLGPEIRKYSQVPLEPSQYPDVVFDAAGHVSHQQLAVAPVSLKPPEKDTTHWGVPQFCPVVFDGTSVPGAPYRVVKGADPDGSTAATDNDPVWSGFRTFGVVTRDALLGILQATLPDSSFDSFLQQILSRRFIGTVREKIGSCCVTVDLGGFLVDF